MNQWRWMLAVIMGWDSVELESSLGKIFSKIPSLNASHKGYLSGFQLRESRCCAGAGMENNEGRHSWNEKERGIPWDSLTQLLEVNVMTEWVTCLGRLDVLREQVCPGRGVRMVKQKRVQVVSWRVSRPTKTHACVRLFLQSLALNPHLAHCWSVHCDPGITVQSDPYLRGGAIKSMPFAYRRANSVLYFYW